MDTATDATHAVALDAQHLARAGVAAGTTGRIAARGAPVVVARHPDPARRMGIAPIGDTSRYTQLVVASGTGAGGVATAAQRRLSARLMAVSSPESSSVHARRAGGVKVHARGQKRHVGPVATEAERLLVTGRAQLGRAPRRASVTGQKTVVMNDVALRHGHLGADIDMAGGARPGTELIAMLVAAEARGHIRAQGGVVARDALMAAHALAAARLLVGAMFKAQVGARLLDVADRVGQAVTVHARSV